MAAAIAWLGANVVVQLFAFRADRAGDAKELHRVASDVEWLAPRLLIPSSFAVLVFGILLVLDGPWAFGDLWIALGLVGYAFSFLLGVLFLTPESGRIARLIEAHGPAHELVRARISRILALSRFELAVLFAVVLDMSVKPERDDVWFWLLAAALLAAGAALALAGYRRPRGPAADLA